VTAPGSPPNSPNAGERFLRQVARQRLLARAAILWERVWPALWPALALLGVGLIVALLGLPALLPGWLHLVLLAAWLGGIVTLAARFLLRIALPGLPEADRRVERASGLAHRPLEQLTDRLAAGRGDAQAESLWRAHLARTARRIGRLRAGTPRPGMAARDPRAFRLALVLGVGAAFVAAGPDAGARLTRAFEPGFAPPVAVLPPRLDIWIAPPAYTQLPPLFLDGTARRGDITVPVGSRLTAALSGGVGQPELRVGAQSQRFQAIDTQSWSAEAVLEVGENLAVLRDGKEIASWPLAVVPDVPPVIAHAAPPARVRDSLAIRLEFDASDDFGLAQVTAELRLEARPDAPPIVLDLPLPAANAKRARGQGGAELVAHPWAGLPVLVTLVARDGAGQEGRSTAQRIVLPERAFSHPVARLLIAIRRGLSLDPTDRAAAVRELDTISRDPKAFDDDTTVYLALRVARSRLLRDRRPEATEQVQEILWETALRLEEGQAERTERAVQALQEEIRRLLEQAQRGEQIDRAELDRLMRELAEAVQRHMEALAEQMQREGRVAEPNENAERVEPRDLQRMMERMQEAARQDRMADAQRMLEQMERMLETLRQGQLAQPRESPERQQRRQQGQNAQGALNDLVQRQSGLMDRAQNREQQTQQDRNRRPNPQQRQNPQNQQNPSQAQQERAERDQQAGRERQGDQRQQQALRRALGEMMQQFGDATGEVPEPLGRADQEMRAANEALRQGNEGAAQSAQQRAIEALQEGGRQMQQQMARQFGRQRGQQGQQGQPGQEQGEGEGEGEGEGMGQGGGQNSGPGRERADGRDPLGRRNRDANGSADEGSDVRVPDEMEQARTRAIQEELRRRLGERERPRQELDYIDRLLRRF
jgi:uncharacterized protein (TIGR02302 family)